MSRYPRIVGALVTGWGILAVANPGTLTRHAQLGDPLSPPARAVTLSRAIGLRDIASGLSLLTLRPGRQLQRAVIARVIFDASDALGFGLFAPTTRARMKIAAAASAVALVCASTYTSAAAN